MPPAAEKPQLPQSPLLPPPLLPLPLLPAATAGQPGAPQQLSPLLSPLPLPLPLPLLPLPPQLPLNS